LRFGTLRSIALGLQAPAFGFGLGRGKALRFLARGFGTCGGFYAFGLCSFGLGALRFCPFGSFHPLGLGTFFFQACGFDACGLRAFGFHPCRRFALGLGAGRGSLCLFVARGCGAFSLGTLSFGTFSLRPRRGFALGLQALLFRLGVCRRGAFFFETRGCGALGFGPLGFGALRALALCLGLGLRLGRVGTLCLQARGVGAFGFSLLRRLELGQQALLLGLPRRLALGLGTRRLGALRFQALGLRALGGGGVFGRHAGFVDLQVRPPGHRGGRGRPGRHGLLFFAPAGAAPPQRLPTGRAYGREGQQPR